MHNLNRSLIFFILLLGLQSCGAQTNENCKEKLKMARELGYKSADRPALLDSVLVLVNESLECKDTRKYAVDFKIRVLIGLRRFSEAISFVDSTGDDDYAFSYGKNMQRKALIALKYDSEKNPIKRDSMYKEIASDLERCLKRKDIIDAEFKDIYTYLFQIKERFLNDEQINREVDSLIIVYPDKKFFF